MATRTRTDDIEALRKKVLDSVHRIVDGKAEVTVGWLGESAEEEEVLVQITLPDPGEGKTWDQEVTNAIRTAVRAATAETLPSAVATTRLVPAGDDG